MALKLQECNSRANERNRRIDPFAKTSNQLKPKEVSMQAKRYKFCQRIGPGGVKCPCCGYRGFKKRANRKFRKTGKGIANHVSSS